MKNQKNNKPEYIFEKILVFSTPGLAFQGFRGCIIQTLKTTKNNEKPKKQVQVQVFKSA